MGADLSDYVMFDVDFFDHEGVAYDDEFTLQYYFSEFMIEQLADCMDVYNGDLEEMLILAVVGQSLLKYYMNPHSYNPNVEEYKSASSSSRIADVSRIPRSTVLRKLKSLHERGLVVQIGNGYWRLSINNGRSVAERNLGAHGRRSLDRVKKLVSRFKENIN